MKSVAGVITDQTPEPTASMFGGAVSSSDSFLKPWFQIVASELLENGSFLKADLVYQFFKHPDFEFCFRNQTEKTFLARQAPPADTDFFGANEGKAIKWHQDKGQLADLVVCCPIPESAPKIYPSDQ